MTDILTLQQISDIDTFTLEEKIQELVKHPLAKMYEQLIAIAKLQLKERYKVQQFGRMLLNDEIPIIPQFKPTNVHDFIIKKQINKSQRKIDYAECLKKTLITQEQAFIIGKPTVANYKHITRQTISSASNTSFAKNKKSVPIEKKQSSLSTKTMENKINLGKNIISKNIGPLPSLRAVKMDSINKDIRKSAIKSQFIKIQPQTPQQNMKTLQSNSTQSCSIQNLQQLIIQQQKECKKIQATQKDKDKPIIKYIENDVYADEKLILDAPQKLTDLKMETQMSEKEIEQKQCVEIEVIETEISAKQQLIIQQVKDIKQNKSFKIEKENVQETKQQLSLYEQFKKEQKIKQERDKVQNMRKINEIRYIFSIEPGNRSSLEQSYVQKQQEKNNDKEVQKTPISSMENIKSPKKQEIANKNCERKGKSISFSTSNLQKVSKAIQINSNNSPKDNQLEAMDVVQLKVGENNIKPQKAKISNKTVANFNKSNKISAGAQISGSFRIIQRPLQQLPANVFNYHQIIPTFNKLFPHSPSLINDLRQIQKQLQDHVNKKVATLSLNDEYLKIREQQLLFKSVSELEKAVKYKSIFDICLDSFIERSQIMIDRIKIKNQVPSEQKILLYRVVRQKQDVYDIINNAFHRTDYWFELPHGMDLKTSWNLLWSWSRPQINIKELFYFQKVNHFFGNKEIARKDLLKKNIERIKKLGNKAKASFDIIPQTYFLPGENMQFVRKFKESSMSPGLNYWIMKPVGLSRGRGIQLVSKLEDIVFSQPVVLQKYLSNPLLLDGHKFDMRIYVLVTSMNPLQAYVYKQGFARISTQKYSLDSQDINNKFIHLTNFSVQKENLEGENTEYRHSFALSNFQKEIGGCKITLKMLRQKLAQVGIKWQPIQFQIDSIVLKSLISTMNVIQQNPNCFQLFGYDIIIDENEKCWLIEVNSSPSLEKDFTIDEIIKQQLVDDIIQIVDPVPYDRVRLLEIVNRRRKELQGLKSHINTQNNSTHQLNMDLHYILHGKHLRKYGDPCANKNFRRVAPGSNFQNILKTVQQYKLTAITKQQAN